MPMSQTVIFRCNVSALVGIGHLMRCREMARHLQLSGWQSVLIGLPDALRTTEDDECFVETVDVEEWDGVQEDAARVLALCDAYDTRLVVMDDYRVDPEYQGILKAAGVRWLQQFDASKPWEFQPDLLVNASPFETRAQYMPWLKNLMTRRHCLGQPMPCCVRSFVRSRPGMMAEKYSAFL